MAANCAQELRHRGIGNRIRANSLNSHYAKQITNATTPPKKFPESSYDKRVTICIVKCARITHFGNLRRIALLATVWAGMLVTPSLIEES